MLFVFWQFCSYQTASCALPPALDWIRGDLNRHVSLEKTDCVNHICDLANRGKYVAQCAEPHL